MNSIKTKNRVLNKKAKLEKIFNELVEEIPEIPMMPKVLMPDGWGKAAKGRTVWRFIEEVVNQNLEHKYKNSELNFKASESEVSVYDTMMFEEGETTYINIKSSTSGFKTKADVSKAERLLEFYNEDPNRDLFIATFDIEFSENKDFLTIKIVKVNIIPIISIEDIYVNPSSNANMQANLALDTNTEVIKGNLDFIKRLKKANEIAKAGGIKKYEKLKS